MDTNSTEISKDTAHKRRWETFEIIFGVPFLAALALHWIKPLTVADIFATPGILLVGIILIIFGLMLIVFARQELRKHRQPTDPGHPTTQLVTSGVFSISRNPLYLGGISILFGIALAFSLPWVIIFILPTLIAGHYILILPEERYLANIFAEEYSSYTLSVRRWIGRSQDKAA